MDLSKIVAVSGFSGLFEMAANRSNGLIVEDLDTQKRHFVSSRKHQFTPLESISIYISSLQSDTISLMEVFQRMQAQWEENPPVSSKASPEEIVAYFTRILPEYDRERVYLSDMKKVVKWFSFLHERGLLTHLATADSGKITTPETD